MTKKKLLYITELFPYPADSGGTIKTLNTLRALAAQHEVFFVCFSATPLKSFQKTFIQKLVKKYACFILPQINYSEKKAAFHVLQGYIHGWPHLVSRYTSSHAYQQIQDLISSYKPDIIHIDHINMTQYLPATKKQLWILEEQNIEYQLIHSQWKFTQNFKKKLYYFMEMTLTYRLEKHWLPRFDHVFCISLIDKNQLTKLFGLQNTSVFPVVYEPLKGFKKSGRNSILFVGGLNWPPNTDAVEWFITNVFPSIRKRVPDVEFHIVGERNQYLEKRLSVTEAVFFHDYQKDITVFLKQATLFVLPFRMGGGVRIKALTAMSAQLPIVSTPLGVKGLQVRNKKEVLIAKDALEFKKHCLSILKSTNLRQKLQTNSLNYLKHFHSKKNNKVFLQTYNKLVMSA